jgi:phthalate 4,5-cis-dihydrodiol dehydrogenase
MACTTAECSDIISAAERHSVKILVGHLLHFSLSGMVARRIIDSGQLGRPMVGSSALLKTWMEPNRRSWHLDPATGGGMLMTAGIHALDVLIWLIGARVSAVSAVAATCFHEQTADDTSMLLLRFADGRLGHVTSIGYRDGAGNYGATVVCERGTLRVEFGQGVSIGQNGSWTLVPNSHEADWMQRALEREGTP